MNKVIIGDIDHFARFAHQSVFLPLVDESSGTEVSFGKIAPCGV